MGPIKKLFACCALLVLAACTVGTSPVQEYFQLKQRYALVLVFAADYRSDCDKQPTTACKSVVKKMQTADNVAKVAFDQADRAFANAKQDDSYRQIASYNARVALQSLEKLVMKGD